MDEKKKFKVLNDKGVEVECEPLFTFESEETKKQYVVYTDNIYRTDLQGTIICEMDGNGNYRFFSEKE